MLLRWFCIIANKMCKRFVSAFMHQRPYVFKLSIYMSICLFVSIYLLPDKPLPNWLTDHVHAYICLPVHLRCLYFDNKWKEIWHAFCILTAYYGDYKEGIASNLACCISRPSELIRFLSCSVIFLIYEQLDLSETGPMGVCVCVRGWVGVSRYYLDDALSRDMASYFDGPCSELISFGYGLLIWHNLTY